MRPLLRLAGMLLLAGLVMVLGAVPTHASTTLASGPRAAPDILGCTEAPTPEVPGRGVVGFFESSPKTPPAAADPFAAHATTSIYEQYGYAGLRFNTYDLGCGPDIARAPDATVGTAVANWMLALPKAGVAATGAVVSAAFQPDFLGSFDPLITRVVDTLRHAVFEQWFAVVVAAMGLLLIWRARKLALASSAAAIGWALLVMVLVTMVFRWPLVAGEAADATVTTTLGAVTSGLHDQGTSPEADAGTKATAGMQEALLYQAWLGGTFGDANSDVARKYGPVIFDATAMTWREAQILKTDPAEGERIVKAKQKKFEEAAGRIKAEDPDAYEYLQGKRSDSRVGYALLAGLATLCAVPFLLVSGLLVLGALIIVRFGVMLFPAFATLGLFPPMRSLVTGIGSTVAAALINALVFGIGAAVTVLGMGILLAPDTGTPPWLDIILMLLLSVVMWVALRPFRRLTTMVSSQTNHFGSAAGGAAEVARGTARQSGRILTTALGTFLGTAAAGRQAQAQEDDGATAGGATQRAEALTSYAPVPVTANGNGAGNGAGAVASGPAALSGATLSGPVRIDADSVTVVGGPGPGRTGAAGSEPLAEEEIYRPSKSGARAKVQPDVEPISAPATATGRGEASRGEAGRGEAAEPVRRAQEPEQELDELSEVFRPTPSSSRS